MFLKIEFLAGRLFTGLMVWSLFLSGAIGAASAPSEYKPVNSGVKYQFIGQYSIDDLNKILTKDLAEFSNFPVTYPPAKNAVKLYRVIYQTVIPEKGNLPVSVSGLIAVPDVAERKLPVVSYQHGTVFSRAQVPSTLEDSPETRLMIANFAGQGYVVIAADYTGKGVSPVPEGYLVKDMTAQACVDMLLAADSIFNDLNIQREGLFLSGWSQGAYNTMVFLKKLETLGIPVKAAVAASTPNDPYLCMSRWIHVESELDVNWLVGCVSLIIHSYEEYYDMPGLSRAAIKPKYWQTTRDLYMNKITWEKAAKLLPAKTKDLLQDDFAGESSLVGNRFFRQLQENKAYTWRYQTPTRFYYGEIDEVIVPYVAKLPVEYQTVMAGALSTAVFAGKNANHRGTFLFGINDQKKWFDEFRGK